MSKLMKSVFYLFVVLLSSCSMQKILFKKAADALAPSYKQREKEEMKRERLREQGRDMPNPMLAFLGEEDVGLVEASLPIILKSYEMMMLQDREHEGLSRMTGEFYVMYANAFVENPALYLPDSEYDIKNEAFMRARKLYLKGRSLLLSSLDISHPGFKVALDNEDESKINEMLSLCGVEDVEALFWAGAASLAAFAIEPLNTEVSGLAYGGASMLERAAELSPSFNNGSIWEVLTKFYAAAPDSLGGGIDKAITAYEKALEFSGGNIPSVYVTFATSFCIPKQDSKGFDEAIDRALAIDPNAYPESVLMFTISQNYARWLKLHKSDFILEDEILRE